MLVTPTATRLDTRRLELAKQVFLVQGKQGGKPIWIYARIRKEKLEIFQHHLGKPGLDVSRYGEILYSGWGESPPNAVVNQLKRDLLQ